MANGPGFLSAAVSGCHGIECGRSRTEWLKSRFNGLLTLFNRGMGRWLG